jgi:RNA polymerase sigma-70 factor (ECF subfamily)
MAESENILLQRFVKGGDATAFSEIVRRHAGLVYAACVRVLGDADRAADATQETFFQFLRDAGRITGSLPNWLHRVATGKAVDVVRNDSSRRRREAEYADLKQRQVGEWRELSPYVDQALDALDDEEREMLIRYFFEGCSMAEIAAAKGISHPTVSRRIEKGIGELRAQLRRRGLIVAGAALTSLLGQNAAQAAPAAVLQELGKIALVGSEAAAATTVGTAGASATGAGTAASGTGAKVAAGVLAGVKGKVIMAAAITVVGVGSVATYNYVTEPSAPKQPASPAAARQYTPSSSQSSARPVVTDPVTHKAPTTQETDWSQGEGRLGEQIFTEDTSVARPAKPVPTASRSEESVTEAYTDGYVPVGVEEADEETNSRQQEMNTVAVEVKNSNGSISTVKLQKHGSGYVDPRGTYFDHLPTGEELHPIYGF